MLVAPETIAAIAQKSGLTPKEVYREFEAWGLRIRGGVLGRDKGRLDTNLVGVNGFITRSNKVVEWRPDEGFAALTSRVNVVVNRAAAALCPAFVGASKAEKLALKHEFVYPLSAVDIFTDEGLRDTLEYEHPDLKMDDETTTVRSVVNAVARAARQAGMERQGVVSRHAGDLDIARNGRCPELVAMLQLAQLSSSHTARARS
jgi:hypothetical protein